MLAIYSFQNPRHIIIKYEDLVTSPRETTHQIFNFLGLTYEDHIIENFNQHSLTSDLSKVNQPKLRGSITSDWIGRWKDAKHKTRIDECLQHPKALYWLEHSGYECHW